LVGLNFDIYLRILQERKTSQVELTCAFVAANHQFFQATAIDFCFQNGVSLVGAIIRRYYNATAWT